MVKSEKTGRDLDALTDGLRRWLEVQFDPSTLPDVKQVSTVATGGLSNETLIIDTKLPGGDARRYVLRAPPPDMGLFPDYNLGIQGEIQARLAKAGIPSAAPIAYEADTHWIGCQFLLMPMLDGRSPTDFPCYIDEGWVRDMAPADQLRMVDNFLYWTTRMNRLDIEKAGLDIAARSRSRGSRLEQEFAWWKEYLTWVSPGQHNSDVAEVARVVEWCERHWPEREPPPSFVWGDARPPNALYADDLSIRGVLDFENAALSPAELDLGTWLTYRQNLMSTRGGSLPELPGYPDRKQSIEMFEHHLGRKTCDVVWHEMFASIRQGSAVIGIKEMWRRRGLGELPITSVVPEWQQEAMGDRIRR